MFMFTNFNNFEHYFNYFLARSNTISFFKLRLNLNQFEEFEEFHSKFKQNVDYSQVSLADTVEESFSHTIVYVCMAHDGDKKLILKTELRK